MYSKKSLVLVAAVGVLLATPALAANFTDERDSGLSVRQTQLDEQYARRHPTIVPGTPPSLSTPYGYGYVPPHRPAAKHRHGNR
jgi:hypothetical protein